MSFVSVFRVHVPVSILLILVVMPHSFFPRRPLSFVNSKLGQPGQVPRLYAENFHICSYGRCLRLFLTVDNIFPSVLAYLAYVVAKPPC
jgi:hypothetical protein